MNLPHPHARKRMVTVPTINGPKEVYAPNLKFPKRASKYRDAYWIAPRHAVARGYRPKTARLLADPAAADYHERVAEECRRLNGDVARWLREHPVDKRPVFNGTVASLIDLYLKHPASPFHEKEFTTQQVYRGDLRMIETSVGARRLDHLTPLDFLSWYKKWRLPAEPGGPVRMARAKKAIVMLRLILTFGTLLELKDCIRLRAAIAEMRFEQGKPRRETMSYAQAASFVEEALNAGQVRLALGHACQFELMLRQGDVIGKWRPATEKASATARYRRGDSYWSGQMIFENLSSDAIIVIHPAKTKHAEVSFDLKRYPLIQRCLAHIPPEERRGAFVVDRHGQPFDRWSYSEAWRKIADRCGIPSSIWNMDNRASGVTEARDAGAALEDVSKAAAHASIETTRRIYDRSQVAVTNRVQDARVMARQQLSGVLDQDDPDPAAD
jgi:hypothetical protein